MTKSWVMLAAGVALAACSDSPTAVPPDAANSAVAEPGTEVSGIFTIVIPKRYLDSPINVGPNEDSATCFGHGIYYYQFPELEDHLSSIDDPHCTVPETTLTVTFNALANYVQAASGNINLDFSVCGYAEGDEGNWVPISCEGNTYVHFQSKKNSTSGAGTIYGTGDDGSTWSIDLTQIDASGDAGLGARMISDLLANEIGGEGRSGSGDWVW